jgi:hypothetical protein
MMKHRKILFCAALVLICSVASWGQTTATSGAAQTQQAKPDEPLRKPSTYSGSPIVGEFQPNQTESAPEHERRKQREDRYGDFLQQPLADPGASVHGQTETSNLTFIDYVKLGPSTDPPGIPVSESTAVVVGTVLSGKCFVNAAHTFVYTDYQVKIDQILKPDPATNLESGSVVIASRPGGAIRFPSGHVTNVLNVGHGMPEIGAQYILFLWRSIPNLPEYEIVIDSGFELKNGRAYPLDDANSKYDGIAADSLLTKIQSAVKGAKQ